MQRSARGVRSYYPHLIPEGYRKEQVPRCHCLACYRIDRRMFAEGGKRCIDSDF